MTKSQFISDLTTEITEGGSLPLKPNSTMIEHIIKRELIYFREKDDESVETEYIVIDNSILGSKLFKEKRMIKLGSCVEAIMDVKLANGLNLGNSEVSKDYRRTNYSYNIAAMGGSFDGVLNAIGSAYYQDFLNKFELKTISFRYNPHTNMLFIRGGDPFATLVAEAAVHIHDEAMFDRERFFRWVCAKCRLSISRTSGAFKLEVAGKTLDLSEIKAMANEELKEIKEEIKDSRAYDFFIME